MEKLTAKKKAFVEPSLKEEASLEDVTLMSGGGHGHGHGDSGKKGGKGGHDNHHDNGPKGGHGDRHS